MKKIFLFCVTVALTLLAASCQKEEPFVTPDEMASQTVKVYPVSLSITEDDFADAKGGTKSQLSSSTETIQRAILFAMGSDGKVLLRENASGQAVPITKTVSSSAQAASFTWDLPVASFTIYAIANYDDATATTLNSYASNVNLTTTMLNNLTYTNSSTTFLTTIPAKGMPAAGTKAVTISTPGGSIGSVNVKKLFARYDIKFNTDYFTAKGYTVKTTAIQSVSSPSTISWFQANQKPGSGASYNALDSATSSDLNNVSSSGCTLYVLENCQGTKSGFAHWYDVQFATSSELAGLTNILINTTYTDGNNLERKAVCRVYLGSDCRTDFNVRRGVKTDLNLELREGIGREIYLGDGSIITSGPAVVHVVPFYTTLKSKDELTFGSDDWFTLGDVTFGANTGTVHPECGYTGTVTYTVNSNARANNDKKIFVRGKSTDKSGSVVQTDVYDEVKVHFPYSFDYQWTDNTAPNHMAQRGILTCIDRYTNTASGVGVFSTDIAGIVLGDYGEGAKTVTLKGAFPLTNNAIHIQAPNTEGAIDIPLEGRLPFFECSDLTPATNYIDAQGVMNFAYLQSSASGSKTSTRMEVTNNGSSLTAVTVGNKLDMNLVDELFPPKMESTAGRLNFRRELLADGSFIIHTHVHTYQGVAALITSNKTFTADNGTISMKNYSGTGREPKALSFVAWNPWWLWYQAGQEVHSGAVMNDYTLYHEPAGWKSNQAGLGWESTPMWKPTETQEYSTELTNVIISSPNNLKLDASFQVDGGYLGSKVCQGSPGIVHSDFTPATLYRLVATVASTASYDWKTFGDYLWFDHGHDYLAGGVWDNPLATDAEKKNEIDNAVVYASSEGGFKLTNWVQNPSDAWAYAPAGVSASNPNAITGVHFDVVSQHVTSNWTMTYSMKDLGDNDIETHNAGKVNVVMRVMNPFNEASPSLDNTVATAYVRLHLYIWPRAYAIEACSPGYGSSSPASGWKYSAYPYCYTEGHRVKGLDKYNFWEKSVILPAAETLTGKGTTFYYTPALSFAYGRIGTDYQHSTAPVYWQFHNNDAWSTNSSTLALHQGLMEALSGFADSSTPFVFRPTNNTSRTQEYPNATTYTENIEGLNSVLGESTFYRPDDRTLYYDPTGSAKTYTYDKGSSPNTDKLFVIHIHDGALHIGTVYYFDPTWLNVN